MDSSVSLEDRIWFLRVRRHIQFSLYIKLAPRFKLLKAVVDLSLCWCTGPWRLIEEWRCKFVRTDLVVNAVFLHAGHCDKPLCSSGLLLQALFIFMNSLTEVSQYRSTTVPSNSCSHYSKFIVRASLESLAQDPRKEIMDLRNVNKFTLLPIPCCALPGAWNWSCRGHFGLVVWAVYIAKIRLRTGCKILFRRIFRRGQRVACGLRVLLLCWWQSILVLFRDRGTFLYHEASPKYWDFFL